ncbi:hypothetical protein [Micromonospora profundi]|uniref:hypothetical protein n=1 Tax=Micromonospora profundi TaxID=1420889 RepID=UPI00366804B6
MTNYVHGVARALNARYGDATLTPLDLDAARDVIAYLRDQGWADPTVVAGIVEAAGGDVTLTERVMVSAGALRVENEWPASIRLRTSTAATTAAGAAVNDAS